jgi:two-component system nitrogen regulation sensor histidine kinase NtrY
MRARRLEWESVRALALQRLEAAGKGAAGAGDERRRLPAEERRRRRRDWRLAALAFVVLAALLAVEQELLARSRALPIGSDTLLLVLVHVSVILIGLLVFLLARNAVKLFVDRRAGRFGSRLNTRFVVSFVFATALSSTALFVLSALLVSRAVNVWFELELSESLDQSVEIAEAYYAEAEKRALFFARQISQQIEQDKLLGGNDVEALRRFVAKKQAEYDLGVVEVFNAQLEELAIATHPEIAVVAFDSPSSALIRAGLEGVERSVVEGAGPGDLVRAVVPVRRAGAGRAVEGVVVVNRFLPRAIGTRVEAIRTTRAAYERLQPQAGTFEGSMLMLLAMITLSSVLFSSWIGFRLAKQVTEPIERLAGATAEVGAGNLDVRVEEGGRDEIAQLVDGFNRMATDLSKNRADLERRRTQMEIILRAVGAGVISLDADFAVRTINPQALRLLGVAQGEWVGRKLGEMLGGHALETLSAMLHRLASGPHETLRRQMPVAVAGDVRTLNWTVSRMHDGSASAAGFVVVVDDVTEIMRVQRMAAWREMARRIAHEIKNPLTPIQLTAQRLQRKLAPKISDPEAASLLREGTAAITAEVDAMKHLLAEFSSFARLPATDPAPTDLNKLVNEVVELYRGNASIEFKTELDPQLPMLDLDRQQIRRVILNLVDNAISAIDEAGPGPREVHVSTRLDAAVGTIHLQVADTGAGIRAEDRARLFEPGFSTKRAGSGLGLAIVSRIVSDHSGYVRVVTNRPRGSRFIVELPARTEAPWPRS